MSTTLKVMYSVQVLKRLLEDTGSDIEPISSIFLPLKPYRGFDASFNCFLPKPHLLEARKLQYFCLTSIIY
jgi:hypothetical protein